VVVVLGQVPMVVVCSSLGQEPDGTLRGRTLLAVVAFDGCTLGSGSSPEAVVSGNQTGVVGSREWTNRDVSVQGSRLDHVGF